MNFTITKFTKDQEIKFVYKIVIHIMKVNIYLQYPIFLI
jgi:hypothetical protein